MATSLADSTKTASAAVSLVPTIPTTILSGPPPVTSVSPNQTSLTSSQTQQFSVVGLPSAMGGATSITVGWSINPSVGGITPGGLYTSPGTVSTQQTVVVTAMNAANSAVLGTASVTLTPPVAPPPPTSPTAPTAPPAPAAPTGLTATPGIGQVTLNWTASSGASSYNVKRATMSGGPYTTVGNGVTTNSLVNTGLTGGTTYYYVVSALNASGESSNSGEASAQPTVPVPPAPTGLTTNEGNGQVTLNWTPSPGATSYNVKLGTVSGGPYTTVGSVTTTSYLITGLNNGTTYYYVVSAVNASGESPNSGQLNGHPIAPPTPTTIQLPLEVVGPDGTTVTVSLPIPTGTSLNGQLQLWMQIHGLRYETQASVSVNNSGWLPISSSSVTLLGQANAYGGIGGGFHTLTMTMNLPAGSVVSGSNTVSFRFNGTDGRVSGYRVLAFNVQNSGGSLLIPSSTFVNEDPNAWQPPSPNSSDVTAGQTLWHQASLTVPTAAGAMPIKAHCSDCHAQDGRDLKYFNYSNNSVRSRSMFHGLTAQQGDQIATYIRSLNVPNPGRPWNPPYQPGPGLDSQPVANWSAGAGIGAVLNSDQDLMNELFPTGVQASFFSPNAVLNIHETALPLQLPDWNSWLPTIHPMDAWNDFLSSNAYLLYLQTRAGLRPGDPVAYANNIFNFQNWAGNYGNYIATKTNGLHPSVWTPAYVNQVYSTGLWTLVKNWELNQEFGLEGMARAMFTNPKADSRAWYSNFPFLASPNMLKIPVGAAGLDNGRVNTWDYLAQIWYQVQLVLDNSEYQQNENSPIDWAYVYAKIGNDLSNNDTAQAGLFTVWMTKGLQISNNGIGPDKFPNTGWNWSITDISRLITPATRTMWVGTPASTRTAISNGFVQAWLAEVQQFTPQQFWAGGINSSALPIHFAPDSPNFEDRVWYMIPQFKFFGVDQTLINQMAAWAQTVWPNGNWAATTSATCWEDNSSVVRCSTEQ